MHCMTKFFAVGTSSWNPWIVDCNFNNFSTLPLKFNHWRKKLCEVHLNLNMR
uniref:Uncharacterized protein n=1 Tax=Brassica oleracea var. oleracea TaxID=109376 RepID=A0A0D3DS01_BRAOL